MTRLWLQLAEPLMPEATSGRQLYTDGSSDNGRSLFWGGWAWVELDGSGQVIASDSGAEHRATSSRMELYGLVQAIQAAYGTEATIYSDSQYGVLAITRWWRTWAANGWRTSTGGMVQHRGLIETGVNCLTPDVKLVWVRGHNGLYGNELADDLAGRARVRGMQTGVSRSFRPVIDVESELL